MKKVLCTIGALMFTLLGFAQFNGIVGGTVTDSSGNPVIGVAVFNYGSIRSLPTATPSISQIRDFDYTDTAGYFQVNYAVGGTISSDTVLIGVADCNLNVSYLQVHVNNSGSTNPGWANFSNICRPGDCDMLTDVEIYASGTYKAAYFLPLIDSNFTSTNAIFEKTVNGTVRYSGSVLKWGQVDTISGLATDTLCYRYLRSCPAVCPGYATPPPPPTPTLNCNASFYVDSANSINFQGQVVIWNNSSTDSGAVIIDYAWDFGDGNTSNQQYPIHNYADTGVYTVCLTITSINSVGDTCTDTFCAPIGFDANGNLIYKTSSNGFTINVIDPATVGLNEADLFSSVKLYPNPSKGEANLTWDVTLEVERVHVISLSGQLLQELNPTDNRLRLTNLQAGIYLVRLEAKGTSNTLRMVVQ